MSLLNERYEKERLFDRAGEIIPANRRGADPLNLLMSYSQDGKWIIFKARDGKKTVKTYLLRLEKFEAFASKKDKWVCASGVPERY